MPLGRLAPISLLSNYFEYNMHWPGPEHSVLAATSRRVNEMTIFATRGHGCLDIFIAESDRAGTGPVVML
jgi:hypothetical protein